MNLQFQKFFRVIVFVLALSDSCAGREQGEEKLPFSPGEVLNYEITWSVFSAGEVAVTLGKSGGSGPDALVVKTTARTHGIVSILFKVQDEFDSYINPDTLCSLGISKGINEGRRHRQAQILFDPGRRLAVLDERDPTDPKVVPKHEEHEIPGCVQDVISAFYFVRNMPLQVGHDFLVPINDGGKTLQIKVEVQARERIDTYSGRRDTLRVEPTVFTELFKRKGRLLIWLSDDGQRFPLRIKAMTSSGTLVGNLKSAATGGSPAPQPKH